MRIWRVEKCVLSAVIMIGGLWIAAWPINASETSIQSAAYLPHDQIVIFGDDGFTTENGVVSGNGTYSDPYVIEEWDIDISDIDPDTAEFIGGIHIGNTEAYLVVRNVKVHGDFTPIDTTQGSFSISGNPAITMYYGANVRIENCVLTNTTDGIMLHDMQGVTVLGNTITGNSRGIQIDYSSNIRIEDNHVSTNQFGNVVLTWISNSIILNNTITDSGDWVGMDLYDSDNCDVLNNTISDNPAVGLNLGFCSECTVKGNTISGSRVGIYVYYEEDLILEENVFQDNEKNVKGLSEEDTHLVPLIAAVLIVVMLVVVVAFVLMKRGQKKDTPP